MNEALDGLLDGVALHVNLHSGSNIEERLSYPSLVSCIAKIAVDELRSGFALRFCDSCGKQFMTDAYQRKYCSDQCNWKEAKRRQRSSNKTQEFENGKA